MSGLKKNSSVAFDTERARAEFARALSAFRTAFENRPEAARSGRTLLSLAFELVVLFERLSSRLYRARAVLRPEEPQRRRLEEYVTEVSQAMLAYANPTVEKEDVSFTTKYRRVWRENLPLFCFTALIFLTSGLIGGYVVYQDPASVSAFVPASTMEQVIAKVRWFDDVQSNPFFVGLQIAKNNIMVSIYAFIGAALLGIGGLYILLNNGLMFGALMAFCLRYDFIEQLGTFVISHGMLELSIIVAAAFAGFLFGRVFYMRPYSLFRVRWQKASTEAGLVLIGVLPWLVLAAALEVFVSPWPYFTVSQRWIIGAIAATLFWGWTFLPPKPS